MTRCLGRVRCARVTCQDFNLEHENPALFVKPQYGPVWASLLWYGLWCGYFTSTMFVDVITYREDSRHLWLVSFSNWNYLMAILTTMGELIVRVVVICFDGELLTGEATRIPWYIKVQWVFSNINNCISILVLVLFFAVTNGELTFPSINKHIVTCTYVIANTLFMTSSPIKILHLYQPMVFAAVYLTFTAVFQFTYHHDTYTKLYDWDNPTQAAILSGCTVIVMVPLAHCVCYCLFKLRIFLRKKCSAAENSPSQSSTNPKVQRDTTATDVILEEDTRNYHYIDVQPDIKDDANIQLNAERERASLQHMTPRLYKSETDLRNYRLTNGFYCDFAKSSPISHHSSPVVPDTDSGRSQKCDHNDNFKGSQIIKVKKCNTPTSSIKDDNSYDTVSNASSDYLSQYIEEDLIAYYL